MSKPKTRRHTKPSARWYNDPDRKVEVSAKISAALKARSRIGPPPPKPEITPGQLVCTRKQTAHTLSRSIPTIVRLENAGVLRKLRLDPSKPTSQVVHSVKQVLALASGAEA